MAQKTTAEPVKTIGQLLVEQAQAEIANKTDEGMTLSAMMDELTEKQRRFVWAYTEIGQQGQAARKAGYSLASADYTAFDLMSHPKISLILTRMLKAKYSAPFVMSKFGKLAEGAKAEQVQLQATDRLARIAGLYDHEQNTNTTGQHLHIHLPQVENKKNIIDVSAKVSEE